MKIVYILGAGRSGSTLVSRLLGQVPHAFSVGELAQVWQRGFVENQLCGCGAPFHDCQVWREVSAPVLRALHPVGPSDVLDAQREMGRLSAAPLLLTRSWNRRFRDSAEVLKRAYAALYRAVQDVTGCRIVVDSSKWLSNAILSNELEGPEVSVLHLVRDSRAVSHSWTRKKARPEIVGSVRYMARSHPTRAVGRWIFANASIEAMSRRFRRFRRLRYEDFVRDPHAELEQIVRWLEPGEEPRLSFLGKDEVQLPPEHSVSGNPMRFQSGTIRIEEDNEWKRAMDPLQRALVGALSAPLLARYGYGLIAGGDPSALPGLHVPSDRTTG
jgi:hypothetical protein